MKKFLRNIPGARQAYRGSRLLAGLASDYFLEGLHFLRFSHGIGPGEDRNKASYHLLKAYHAIEKGLSIGERRLGFGQPRVIGIIAQLNDYIRRFGYDDVAQGAHAAIASYIRVHRDRDFAIPAIEKAFSRLPAPNLSPDATDRGGSVTIHRREVLQAVEGVGDSFFLSRHSMRHFGDEQVPLDIIREAVRRALKTPSVCNRQAPRVYCAPGGKILKLQPGNAGFGHRASAGLVVTADISGFSSSKERHQAYVDGGMFAMSILYAAHSLELAACPLAWNSSWRHEQRIKRQIGIPRSEAIIMFIAIGSMPETFEAATALRLGIEDKFRLVNGAEEQT